MKAILVVDMPKNCLECSLLKYDREIGVVCRHTWTGDYRPSWCPLKPMPERYDEATMREQKGWNACIDELIGEEE